MKTATLPSLRVEPEFREELEAVLAASETVSAFIEKSLRESVQRRKTQAEFMRRGMEALARFKETGEGHATDEVLAQLEAKLEAARSLKTRGGR